MTNVIIKLAFSHTLFTMISYLNTQILMTAYPILAKIMEHVQTLSMTTNVIVWRDSVEHIVKTVSNLNRCKISCLFSPKISTPCCLVCSFEWMAMSCTFKISDVDECAMHPCLNNGTCIDLINDYQCHCINGFNGTNCTISK